MGSSDLSAAIISRTEKEVDEDVVAKLEGKYGKEASPDVRSLDFRASGKAKLLISSKVWS